MGELCKIILSLSASGSVLILCILVIDWLLGSKLSKRWQYYIWILVALRLTIPYSPSTALINQVFASNPEAANAQAFQFDEFDNDINFDLMSPEQARATGLDRSLFRPATILSGLGILWIAVAAGLLIQKITAYQSFAKYVKANCMDVEDIDRLNLFGSVCSDLKICGGTELRVNGFIASPLLFGITRPTVVLPSTDMPTADLRYIYHHELTHRKRRDILYKWLLQVVLCLHWFNPLVHWMVRQAGRMCELSCDEAVIRHLDDNQRKDYGDTLLESLKTAKTYREPIAALTLSENAILLQERLTAITCHRKPGKKLAATALLLTLALLCSGLLVGAYPLPAGDRGAVLTDSPPNPLQEKSTLVGETAYELIEFGGANQGVWYIIGYLLPYMTDEGIDTVVDRFNAEYPGTPKTASHYYDMTIPTQEETQIRAYEIMRRTSNLILFVPLLPYMDRDAAEELLLEYNRRTGDHVNPAYFLDE